MKRLTLALWMAPVVAVVCMLLASCENNGVPDDAVFYIEPPQKTLSDTEVMLVMQAVGGKEPMKWTVSDTNAGFVSGSGRSVTYIRTTMPGVNTVQVQDDNSWTAYSTITQLPVTNMPLTISPPSPTVTNGESVTFYALGGKGPPYNWTVLPPAHGTLSTTTLVSVVYTSTNGLTDNVSLGDGYSIVYAVVLKKP